MRYYRGLLLYFCVLPLGAQPLSSHTYKDVAYISEDSLAITHTFFIYNHTAKPLQIDTVYSDCACTLLEWPRVRIAPHEAAPLRLRYEIRNRLGTFEKFFQVLGQQGSYKKTFTLRGHVVPGRARAAVLYPIHRGPVQMLSEVLNFGDLALSLPMPLSFFVYNSSQDTLTFRNTRLPDHLQLRFLPDQLPPKEVGRWQVSYQPKARISPGYQLDELLIYAETQAQRLPIKCFVAATQHPSARTLEPLASEFLNAAPPMLFFEHRVHNFQKVQPYETLRKRFSFKNIGQDTLRIRQIRTFCDCLQAKTRRSTYAPGETGELQAILRTRSRPGHQKERIEVHSNDPKAPIQLLELLLQVVK